MYLPSKTRSKKRKKKNRFLGTQRWLDARQLKLREEPCCEVHARLGVLIDCTSNSPIDHIIQRHRGGAELDARNLMTLCVFCHDLKTGLEQQETLIEPAPGATKGFYYPTPEAKAALIQRLAEEVEKLQQ